MFFALLISATVMAQGQPKSKAEGNFRLTGQLKELTDSVVIIPALADMSSASIE